MYKRLSKFKIYDICFANDFKLSRRDTFIFKESFGVSGDDLECFGTNAKMNEFAAAMGICNLRHIDDEIASRGEAFRIYDSRLKNVEGITLLPLHEGLKQNYAYYPVLFNKAVFGKSRDEVIALLFSGTNMAIRPSFPIP